MKTFFCCDQRGGHKNVFTMECTLPITVIANHLSMHLGTIPLHRQLVFEQVLQTSLRLVLTVVVLKWYPLLQV